MTRFPCSMAVAPAEPFEPPQAVLLGLDPSVALIALAAALIDSFGRCGETDTRVEPEQDAASVVTGQNEKCWPAEGKFGAGAEFDYSGGQNRVEAGPQQ
jgi:hypothetical protein